MRLAVRGGLDPSVGADIAAGKRPTKMKEDETSLYNYATEMYRDKAVADATYAAAVKAFGEKGVVDLVGVTGYYQLVSALLNVDRYPLPAGAKPELTALR